MAEPYFLTRIWVDRYGWPVTWFRNRPITNAIRWVLFARGRAWWYRNANGGCYPCIWVKQPDGSSVPTMDDGRSAAARMGVFQAPLPEPSELPSNENVREAP